MTEFFDGKAFAKKKEEELIVKVERLKGKGITPKLVSIIIGDDSQSILYQNLKKKSAEKIGVCLDIKIFKSDSTVEEIIRFIESLNSDNSVNGIMIQLPFPAVFSDKDKKDVVDAIDINKDVDGLRDGDVFIAPVVRAVVSAIPEGLDSLVTVVIGAEGFEGSKIVKRLKEMNYKSLFSIDRSNKDISKILKDADIIISATGQPDLVKPDMVKRGVVLIDVGSPKGDVSKDCYEKASYVSPVPGGIGPVTIAFLLENLVNASYHEN